MRILRAALIAAAVFPLGAHAQASDSIQLGERVRVRVAATRGNVNLFVGNVAALSRDTLTLAIPGGKGTIILPRASISEIGVSNGHVSRWTNVPRLLPLAYPLVLIASLPNPQGSHAQTLRNQKYALLGVSGLLLGYALLRPTPERWRPLYSWLDRP